MSEWPEVRLEDVTSKLGDGLHGTPKYDQSGEYYFINGNNLGNGKIVIDEKTKRASHEEYLKYKKELNDRTVLVSINGTIGNVGLYNGEKVFLGKSACYFNVNEDVDKQFVRYVVTSKYFQDYISSLATGSTIKNVSLKLMRNFTFRLPPLNIQKEISKILEDLDNKIELNRQTNQTLEQIAQAIFKSWFVDFEPVKAKAQVRASVVEGKIHGGDQPLPKDFDVETAVEHAAMCAISGKTEEQLKELNDDALKQLKTTAALFPDALVESELGEMPEGWGITDLKSTTTELRRGISPKYTEEDGVLVINQKCIRNHSINFDLARLNDPLKRKVDGRHIEVGDVLVNSTGVGTLGRLAPVRFLSEPTVFDSHVTVVRADTAEISKSFLAGLMLNKEVFIEASGAGSTGQTELRKQVLEEIYFTKPKLDLGMLFDAIAEPINNQIAELEQQQKSLGQTRDALLPKLLAGEIDMENVA